MYISVNTDLSTLYSEKGSDTIHRLFFAFVHSSTASDTGTTTTMPTMTTTTMPTTTAIYPPGICFFCKGHTVWVFLSHVNAISFA